jgi:hypothetical protein
MFDKSLDHVGDATGSVMGTRPPQSVVRPQRNNQMVSPPRAVTTG